MILNTQHSNMLISPARSVVGRVEHYRGSTLSNTFSHTDTLSELTVSRSGEKKFFGFGICQELEVKLVDKDRAINIAENDILKLSLGVEGDYVYPTPDFTVSADIKRDENTNQITLKAYDALYGATAHTFAELTLTTPYTIGDVANAIATLLGLSSVSVIGLPAGSDPFTAGYPTGANFEGTETIRVVLNAIAEATQTIYYIDANNNLIFKRLDIAGEPVLNIRRADYFNLECKTNRILSDICSATELGDNVITNSGIGGEIQYIRDNPFWELRNDINKLIDVAIAEIGGLSMNEFACKWRGNYLVEPGDKISLVTKDGNTVTSYLLDDKYTYDGGMSADTGWEYAENEGESADNPLSLGEALKKTFAKVDKTNKQIQLVASESANNTEQIAQIQIATDSIVSSVKRVEENNNGNISNLQQQVEELTKTVSSTMTEEAIKYEITKQMSKGIDKVTTSTGFTFDETGLTVSKTGTEIETTITEDGMKIAKSGDDVLIADNTGVYATNLHATTYLMIGVNSRFEDYDNDNRTGCFWIGK